MEIAEKIKIIAEHYGYDAQSRQCIEEMADVQIMLWQMEDLLLSAQEVDLMITKKLDRQLERIVRE